MLAQDRFVKARIKVVLLAALAVATSSVGCLGGDDDLAQTGSSTVLPLAERWAESYDDVDVSVSGGGSTHGINSLLNQQAELGDASRKIAASDYADLGCAVSPDEIEDSQSGDHPWEYPECNGVTPTEWVVAIDVMAVVAHPDMDYLDDGLTFEQLRSIFTTENTAQTWDEVPGLEAAPDEEIQIYAPDEASGTYADFFETIADGGEVSLLAAGSDRYSPSSDDNVIYSAVSQNPHSIGFFGFAYYIENPDDVKAIPIASDEMEEPVEPGFDTAGDYPITRPIHVYTDGVPGDGGERSQAIRGYLAYALSDEGQQIVPDVGYVSVADFSEEVAQSQRQALE